MPSSPTVIPKYQTLSPKIGDLCQWSYWRITPGQEWSESTKTKTRLRNGCDHCLSVPRPFPDWLQCTAHTSEKFQNSGLQHLVSCCYHKRALPLMSRRGFFRLLQRGILMLHEKETKRKDISVNEVGDVMHNPCKIGYILKQYFPAFFLHSQGLLHHFLMY